MHDARFQLKIAPPRLGRAVTARPRLERRWQEISERTVIVVTAPQGYGKTTLLAQWRRNWLERGAYAAWATLDAQDDRARFVELLLFALRSATGRESFAAAATQGRLQPGRELDALTELLAEVALLATPTVVILDDAHRMPQATMQELLAYLLNNAPPNLQFLVGSRRPLELDFSDLIAGGRLATIGAGDLRLDLAESLEILRARFANRIGLDDAVRVHDLMEGWPLGLQLAASTIEGASDRHAFIGQLSARRGDLQRFFFESLMARLPPERSDFLVRIAILEAVNADLCRAVTGCAESARYLESLADESPIVAEGEDRDWMRLHAMARDFLLGHFDRLPAPERQACYERAAEWYAAHGQLQEAARHALAAGDEATAVQYAARCLADIAREGRLSEARDWVRRLASLAVTRNVRFQLGAAWITALGSDAPTVPGLIEEISRHPQFDERCRVEAMIVVTAAAFFSDKPGLAVDALASVGSEPEGVTPLHLLSLENTHAALALYAGETDQARRRLRDYVLSAEPREAAMRLGLAFSDVIFGISYLAEGNAARAIEVLEPRLELAEREMGRRSTMSAMLAGVLASALFLRDEPERAQATLADRLDVIERVGMPDPIILGYTTCAGVALWRGDEARALEILEGLRDLGIAREQPRITVTALAELVRLHALNGRIETAGELQAEIEALGPILEAHPYEQFRGSYRRTSSLALGYLALARGDPVGAQAALRVAADVPPHMRRQPLVLVARALLALAAEEAGEPDAARMLQEVMSLAELAGMRRFVEAAHPRLTRMLESAGPPAPPMERAPATRASGSSASPAARAASGGLLTPKEARILSLLAAGKANKEIARAMDIGEQTVKWHLKNVFYKLNAASRKHAVDRARLLGLLEG